VYPVVVSEAIPGPPFPLAIGLRLSQVARTVSRAFEEALAEADGSPAEPGSKTAILPVWLVLLNLKIRKPANQRELAEAVGIREATLTHHLNAMDRRGLVTRTRDPANRRIHVVELTEAGEAMFSRLQQAAIAFDASLRAGLAEEDLDNLRALLGRLAANAGGTQEGAMPWAGLADTRD
jgi:MarR family transcriptional regulator, transcriptional regulator for hemolysin